MSSTSITCGAARRLLWPDQGPRAASPDVVAAQRHVAVCEDCQRFIEEMAAWRAHVHGSARRDVAPPELRDRVFASVARVRAGEGPAVRRSLRPYRWLAAAVVLLAAGLVIGTRLLQPPTSEPLKALAQEHASVVGETEILSSDREVVQRWIATHARFAVYVPELPDARLVGARLRMADGGRGASVQYEVNGVSLSYFVIPVEAPVWEFDPDHPAFERTSRAGYRVIAWREPGMLHAMVANLTPPQLETLAVACIKQARRATT